MTRPRLARVTLPAAAVALALLVAGCGLPVDDAPRHVSASQVPFHLLGSGPTDATPQGRGPTTPLYFVRDANLVPVARHIPASNRVADALRELLDGPTATETAAGLTTAIPARTRLISLDVTGTTARVDVSKEFGEVGGSDQVLAVAEIVYTLTADRLIDAVTFAIEGRQIEVPDGSGSLSTAARTRADYRTQAPSS